VKAIPLFSAILFIGTYGSFAEKEPSILTFADKTRISGVTKAVDGKTNLLTLNSPSLQGESTLKTNKLLEMTLNGDPKPFESDHYALATISNHHRDSHLDSIRGRLIHLDDKTITLDTWYAGKLTLRRSMVRSLDIFSQSPSFYNGPNGPEGWVSSDGDPEKNWAFKNRSMISKSRTGIARQVEIPDRAKISFTAEWKTSPYFRILFYSNDGNQDFPGTGYALNINRTYLSLLRNAPNARNTDVISKQIRDIRQAEMAEFTIFLDRTKEGTSAVYIAKEQIGTWDGIDDTTLKGNWLHFIPQNNETPIKFSNISVAKWDGILPPASAISEEEASDEEEELEGQKIHLANGDIVLGNVLKIEKDMVFLGTSFGDVRVPVKRMRSVGLAKETDEVRMEAGDIRAWFHEGGYITIKLKSLDDKTIKGYSQVYGDAEFDINAFSRVEFNIWRRELDPARYGATSDW
jgi:hypothetical protein|tara:strand:+ start:319 stop:1704 length:1386 start_codon:yes stop_codon:yes gene_type:complete